MKTNVTLKLDADLLREARVVAAEEGRSISALLTDRLEGIVRERKALNGGDSILEALDLEARHQVSFWDALLIQAALASGAEVPYSEDLSDGQHYGGVRVSNPFKASGSPPEKRDNGG